MLHPPSPRWTTHWTRRWRPCRPARPLRTGHRAVAARLALGLAALAPLVGCGGEPAAEAPPGTAAGVDLTPPLPIEFEALDPRASQAIDTLVRSVLADPRSPGLRRTYAATLDAMQFDEAAAEAWVQAAALDLSDPRSRHHLGRLRAESGDHEGAVQAFSAAARQDPGYAPTRWRLGLSLLELGLLDEARQAFDDARKLDPRDPSGPAGLARVALAQDDLVTAEAILSELVEAYPQDGYLPGLLARVARRRGDEARASLLLARPGAPTACFRADPWERELSDHRIGFAAEVDRARDLLAANRPDEALLVLEPLYAEDPAHLAVEGLTVRALLALDQTERAQTILQESLARGDHPHTQVSLGYVLFVQQRFEDALACTDRAIEAQPSLSSAHFLRAKALVALERREEGVQALRRAFESGEEGLEAQILFGRTLAQVDALDEAIEAMAEATDRFPSSLEAWALRCELEFRAGRTVEARRSLAETAARDGDARVVPRLRAMMEDAAPSRGTTGFDDALRGDG